MYINCWSWWWWDHGDQDDNREHDQKMMMLDDVGYQNDSDGLWWIEAVISETKQQSQARYRAWLHICVRSDLWHSGVPIPSNHPSIIGSRFVHRILCQELLNRSCSGRHVGDRLQQMPRQLQDRIKAEGTQPPQGFRVASTSTSACVSWCFLMFLDVSCAVVITSLHYSCLQNHGRVSMTYRVTCCTKVQSIWIVQANCALK